MKHTGMIRQIDELGRITLPIELRRAMDIAERDPLLITLTKEGLFCNAMLKLGERIGIAK